MNGSLAYQNLGNTPNTNNECFISVYPSPLALVLRSDVEELKMWSIQKFVARWWQEQKYLSVGQFETAEHRQVIFSDVCTLTLSGEVISMMRGRPDWLQLQQGRETVKERISDWNLNEMITCNKSKDGVVLRQSIARLWFGASPIHCQVADSLQSRQVWMSSGHLDSSLDIIKLISHRSVGKDTVYFTISLISCTSLHMPTRERGFLFTRQMVARLKIYLEDQSMIGSIYQLPFCQLLSWPKWSQILVDWHCYWYETARGIARRLSLQSQLLIACVHHPQIVKNVLCFHSASRLF